MFKTVRRFMKWCREYRGRLYTGFVYSFFISIFTAMPIMVAAVSLNAVLQDRDGIRDLSSSFILMMTGAILVFVLLRFLFSYLRARIQESVGYETAAKERITIGNILKRVSLGYFSLHDTGEVTATITTELTFMELMGMKMLDMTVNGYINVGVMILLLFFLNPIIALISLAGVLLSSVFLHILYKGSTQTSPVIHRSQDDMASAVVEHLRGMSVVKSFGRSGVAMERLHRSFRTNRDTNIRVEKHYAPINSLHFLALNLASVGIVLASSLFVLDGTISLPTMLTMLLFSFSMFDQVAVINNASHVMGLIDSTLNKLEVLKDAEFIDNNGKDIVLDSFDLTLDKVSFSYGETEVLKDISLSIPQGSTTAVVGPSGSGKTTLCNLIARFYDVKAGSICIGGRDLREFTCDSLLANVSMVFQNVYLFHDTIRNNIGFGCPGAGDDEIEEAARQARCHDFIMELPEGYDTVVGEGGSTLSGGEKQRVSIARAILKDAPIILLDEATASIDPENEHHIQKALSVLTEGRTVVIIAHRLATIEHADQIAVLDEGHLVQSGTHSELASCEGVYNRFLSLRQEAEGWNF